MSKKITAISVDNAIKHYNENLKAGEKKLSRNKLVTQLKIKGVNITSQTLANWNLGRLPKAFDIINEIAEITKAPIETMFTNEKV